VNPGGFSGPVSIMPDPAGSALIVLCNDTDFATVGTLVGTLAQSGPATPVTVKVYPLTSITAPRAIAALRDLFSSSPVGRQTQRIREFEVTMPGAGAPARIDPALVRMTPDPGGASVIVAAPQEAFALIDRLIETIDQSPVRDRLAIRRYELKNARAQELSRTLQSLFDAQRQGAGAAELPQARFVADDRTNSMLVTASGPQHQDVERLLETADASLDQADRELAIITLQQASPSTVQRIVDEVVVGRDPAKKDRIRISAQDGSSLFVVHAPAADIAAVREIVAQVDSAETTGLPVRSIKLERADAAVVATALQKFFTDRAAVSSRPGVRAVNRVAVVGDRRTGTLIVSASNDDFAQVESLVKTFDTPTPLQDFQFKVVPLRHARVAEISNTIKQVIDEMRWETMFSSRQQPEGNDHKLYVEGNESTNSVVLVGRGEGIAAAERVIAALDLPPEQRAATVMRSVVVKSADVMALRSVLQRAFATPGWRPWRGTDPEAITVEVDKGRRALILLGRAERVEQALGYIKELDEGPDSTGASIEAITLTHARADRVSQSLRQFFTDRARAQGVDASTVSVIGSQDGNVLIVSASDDDMKTLRDLVAQIDQPDGGKDRRIEVFVLRNGVARDTADALRSMFARSARADEQVIITPQPSTNSLIVSAPAASYEEVVALLRQLDAAPKGEEANIETVALTSAKAQEVATALRSALPPAIKVTITPVVRSNSLLLTGSKEAIALVMDHIRKLDTEPVRSGLVFRRFRIANADATDVAYTVEQMLRARPRNATDGDASIDYSRQDNTLTVYAPSDQIEEIDKIIRELDTPVGEDRTTEFVKLDFAKAEATANALKNFYGRFAPEAANPGARNVTIISDPVSNSLVIRADKGQWEGIRQLLSKLDTKEYDTSRQLAVIPLAHADAASVAKALNDGLRAPLEEQFRQAQARAAAANRPGNNQRPQFIEPTVLTAAEGLPTVSAEPMTNAVIVFASKNDLERIQGIVRQLDVAGFDEMPMPRIIPLRSGKPSAVAASIRELYLNRQPNQRVQGPKAVLVIGDDSSGALIVRADEEKFAQIKALAETLEQQGQIGRVTPHVVALKNVAAGRLRQTLLATFTETAKAQGETLAIEVDRTSNSLVIASSSRLLEEIKRVIDELDAANTPAAEPGKPEGSPLSAAFTIIDVQNNAPADLKKLLDDMGLTRPQNLDQRGIVSEPVTIVPMTSRRALAVIASPADARAVESLVRALDAEPVDAQQQLAVIPLKMATARPLADTLGAMLKPADPATQAGQTGPARALAEQVRRLGLSKNGLNQTPLTVDLSKPIRLVADVEANALIIASTQGNIDALREVVKLLDTLPVGDAVLVRIFNLENASAIRAQAVIQQLFAQGEAIRRLPGTRRQGLPPTATGQALAGEIAVTVDERTNALIVAGREEAVALVEVLIRDLDSEKAGKWIEPVVIPLKHADSSTLAATLTTILVRGVASTPEALGLQRQYGRLRMLADAPAPAAGAAPGAQPSFVEADLFAPLHGLVIASEDQLNSLIVVGTPANTQVVRQLVAMLDVEAASAANTVRVYPLKFAASERVVGVVQSLFRQREASPDHRPEDRLIVSSDARTNSVIATTSAKSFAILEGLLKTLDGEQTNYSVGLHVVPVMAGDVRQLAPRIDRLMRERIAAAARVGSVSNPMDAFSIEPEPTSNLLIVASSNENLQVVKELVAALTAGADSLAKGERMDIIQLTRSRAAEVAESLGRLYIEKEIARRGAGAVSATANERLNAVVIHGNESDMIELRALANKLDTAEVVGRQQIKWIELKSANAPEVVRLLQSVLAGRPLSGGQARQAMKVQFLRDKLHDELGTQLAAAGRKPTEADIDGAIKDQVTLNADTRTNSIWITAPEPIVRLLSEMIEDIEASSAGARKIEYFKLMNADARQMAEVLRDTFNLRQQGNALVLVPVGQPGEPQPTDPAAPPPPAALGDTTVTAVPDERQALSIAVDARTNTLIVSGTADYLDLVRKLVMELDNIEANERERRVYSLRNAKAKEIETTLKSYFSNESSVERSTLGPQLSGSLMRRLEEEVTVVGDANSNKLVISTSPRYMNTVLSIIDELDASPPQVMIQVLLAEITLDNTDTWGMDVTVGPFGGEGYRIGSTPAGASVATALGVPNLSVSSADFGILIRSLEEQGKLEVLSNPQVMVNNNQTAKIQVGENVAVVNGVERSSVGSSFANIIREDVGIILNVVPSISADGFVRMDIQPEISQLSAKTTQISSDVAAPIINKRAVDTVVTVKDGQSVVIGGLIQTTEEQRRTKVPYLADIPILGLPFRTKKDTNVKTELLVILTPRVIPGEAGMAEPLIQDVTEQSVGRMEDPSKIEDYLERIRLEVKEKRAKEAEALQERMYQQETPPASPGSMSEPAPAPFEASRVMPNPSRGKP
jgi:type II secretion system protein D